MILNGTGSTVTGLTVVLGDVDLFTSGIFGCEASADPSFHTDIDRKRMTVLGERGSNKKRNIASMCFRVGEGNALLSEPGRQWQYTLTTYVVCSYTTAHWQARGEEALLGTTVLPPF